MTFAPLFTEARPPNWQRFARMACVLLPVPVGLSPFASPPAELAVFCAHGVRIAANSR